jgi:hypothetical protein
LIKVLSLIIMPYRALDILEEIGTIGLIGNVAAGVIAL